MFNLAFEPWLPMQRHGPSPGRSSLEQVSLQQMFAEAEDLKGFCGGMSSLDAALHRFAVALAQRAVAVCGGQEGADLAAGGMRAARAWRRLWDDPALLAKAGAQYLDRYGDRFELIGSRVRPGFGQADIPLDRVGAVMQLMPQHTSTRVSWFGPPPPEVFEPAEAARWLLHTLAYDGAGIKTAPGGGRDMGNDVGRLGLVGLLVVAGDSWHHSMVLNLLPYDPASGTIRVIGGAHRLGGGADLPGWERPALAARPERRTPDGYLDYATWRSRRVRLAFADRDGRAVAAGVVVAGGEQIDKGADLSAVEPSAGFVWHRKSERWVPRAVPEDGPLWRHLPELLTETDGARPTRPPTVLGSWLPYLAEVGMLPRDLRLHLTLTGLEYGQHQAVVYANHVYRLTLTAGQLGPSEQAGDLLAAVRAGRGVAAAVTDLARILTRHRTRTVAETRGSQAAARVQAGVDDAVRNLLHLLEHESWHAVAGLADPDRQARAQVLVAWSQALERVAREIAEMLEPARWPRPVPGLPNPVQAGQDFERAVAVALAPIADLIRAAPGARADSQEGSR